MTFEEADRVLKEREEFKAKIRELEAVIEAKDKWIEHQSRQVADMVEILRAKDKEIEELTDLMNSPG